MSAAVGIPAAYFVGKSIEDWNAENTKETRARPLSRNMILFGLAGHALVFVFAVSIFLVIH